MNKTKHPKDKHLKVRLSTAEHNALTKFTQNREKTKSEIVRTILNNAING